VWLPRSRREIAVCEVPPRVVTTAALLATNPLETFDQAQEVIAAYITSYHGRPHSGLNYRTPTEVRQTWDDAGDALQKTVA